MSDLTQEEKAYLLNALHFYKHSIYIASNPSAGTRTISEINDFNLKDKLGLLRPTVSHE
jgi:hypothetical protein